MFYKHQLINLIEILSLAIQWYTVQNASHKGGWWLIKCSIFLAVWLSLAFKMANIKITHLYIYAAYSSIITSVQWPLWLIWAGSMTGIWMCSLILWPLHFVLWHLLTLWETGGSHHQPAEANGPQLLLKVHGWNRLLQGAGQGRHKSLRGHQRGYLPLCKVCRGQGGRTALAALVNSLWTSCCSGWGM